MPKRDNDKSIEVGFLIGAGSIEEFLTRREVEEIEELAQDASFGWDVES
jgi:hypothetical protein